MSIPIRNIYYLLLYSWGHFKDGSLRDVGIDIGVDLPNLLGKVLNQGVHRLLRRGLDRGYISITEETRSPRGKLRLDVMTKQQTLMRGMAACDIDDLTPDILLNQIVKTTLLNLARCRDVEKALRHELEQTAKRMAYVTPIRLSSALFQRAQIGRNTAHYGVLLKICQMVHETLFPDEQGSGSKFANFLEDEARMSALFEDFLRNFYRAELQGYTFGGRAMPWDATAEDEAHLKYLPMMETDITLRSGNRTIIIDAKYYKNMLGGGRNGEKKLHSANLYQMATYLAHVRKREPQQQVSGTLIYPSTAESYDLHYRLLDMPISVVTVPLDAEWAKIHERLVGLVSNLHGLS